MIENSAPAHPKRNAPRCLLTRLRFYLIAALVYCLAACPLSPVAARNAAAPAAPSGLTAVRMFPAYTFYWARKQKGSWTVIKYVE